MTCFICTTCGTQFGDSDAAPAGCDVCDDDRQFVPESGQSWTTLSRLTVGHRNAWRRYEPGLWGIGTEPSFAIGQRALLVRAPSGNVLWDCVSLVDAATVDLVNALGGIAAIAISHPHYYASMVEWSEAFGGIPVYLHAADRRWVMRRSAALRFWEGATHALGDGLTLVHCGGHFEGGAVLHWAPGAGGRGALLTGDIIQVSADRRSVSAMFSYPNYVPLGQRAVERVWRAVAPLPFAALYGAWWDRYIAGDGAAIVERSFQRYLAAISSARDSDPHRPG
jgi:hypothetical protein